MKVLHSRLAHKTLEVYTRGRDGSGLARSFGSYRVAYFQRPGLEGPKVEPKLIMKRGLATDSPMRSSRPKYSSYLVTTI